MVDQQLITSVLLGALLVWAVYRRVRRNFGRQALQVRRLQVRIAILALIGALVLVACARNMELLGALACGAVCGVALGYLGLQHTKFEATPQGSYYTPHTYIGLFVMALFLGRVLFRVLAMHLNTSGLAPPNQNPFDGYQKSPLTMAIFGLLIGYYAFFNIGVLRKGRELAIPAADGT
jgi:F0F1-type ATP synthase assembly protein I